MVSEINRVVFRWGISVVLILVCSVLADAQSLVNTDSLIKAEAHAKTDTGRIKLLIALSQAYMSGTVTKEFYYADEASALADKVGWDKGKMYAEQLIGDSYIKVLAYHDAIVHFKQSIEASRKIGKENVERACMQLMIHCYHMMDSLEQAAAYQKRLLDLTALTGDALNECNQMSAYAERLADLRRYQEAIEYLKKDVILAKTRFSGIQRTVKVADVLNTLATTYARANRTDSAVACLRAATSLADQTDNRGLSAYILSSFCDAYTAAKTYDSAIWYGEQTVRQAKMLNDIKLQMAYSGVLSRLYKDNHQPFEALQYHLAADSLTAIVNNTQQAIEQAMQVTKISMEGQAERNKLEKRALEVSRKNERVALIAALVAVLALLVLTMIIYRNLRQKQKTNRIISQQAVSLQKQNELIDQALKEKEVMLKETHHRIKNNLQLISSLLELQVADMEDEHAKAALRTAQRRIQSIATVHSKLYGSGEDEVIEVSAFASDLFIRLRYAFGNSDTVVKFENKVPATLLPLNTVVLLGLILNELITNSFKHALPHVDELIIGISLEAGGSSYTLQYYDNGPGLPDGNFDAQSRSLGLYLVKRMSKQLKGIANYTFDGGSRFIISFRNGGD